ncbi:MAG TPA: zinc-binding dehydrogenase [Streptosporangiaceae bacterium]|nr:zinc-binding dehydrogenase [Streptosporangiaceae bacterium]
MQAMVADGSGSVRLDQVAEPEPAADEAVISVSAFSVNRGETFLVDDPPPGWRPGKDVAGTVLVPAADGTGPQAGQRVVGHPPAAGWAERVAVPASALAALPDSIDFRTAAALPLAGLTALRLLRVTGSLAGQRVLLTGASGGVGHYVTELAAAQGAVLTAVARSSERGERLRELGAAEVVSDVEQARGPFEVILESVGADVLPAAWRRLTIRGLLVWFGQASRVPPAMNFFDWTGGASATMRKFHYADSESTDAADLATLVRLVDGGHLHPEIGRVSDWRRTAEVVRALVTRQIRGKAILELEATR